MQTRNNIKKNNYYSPSLLNNYASNDDGILDLFKIMKKNNYTFDNNYSIIPNNSKIKTDSISSPIPRN
jgi:hypothetical protein